MPLRGKENKAPGGKQMLKALSINGRPHQHGCTDTALCEVAKMLNEEGIATRIFHIGNKPVRGCIA